MTTILIKGNTTVKFFISKERAEKTVAAGGNVSTTTTALTPLEANREVTSLLRQGYKAKQTSKAR